jgi:hypothetical protein
MEVMELYCFAFRTVVAFRGYLTGFRLAGDLGAAHKDRLYGKARAALGQ